MKEQPPVVLAVLARWPLAWAAPAQGS